VRSKESRDGEREQGKGRDIEPEEKSVMGWEEEQDNHIRRE